MAGKYHARQTDDEIPLPGVFDPDGTLIARALTMKDAEALAVVLVKMHSGLRDRLLQNVNDAIEASFDD